MYETDEDEIDTVCRLLRESENRARRQRAMAATMEGLGDRHGATIARALLRIEHSTLRLASDRLRRLEGRRELPTDHAEAAD